jgi:uncharacterized repeat protein (TIGR03803 family)
MFISRKSITLALTCNLMLMVPTGFAAAAPPHSFVTLHRFGAHHDEGDGRGPYAGLVEDESGNLYGTTVSGGAYKAGTIFRIAPDGIETVLYSFQYKDDGALPSGALIIDSSGNLLGTAARGGSKACTAGCGTVFKFTPGVKLIVLHSFQGGKTDGENSQSALLADTNGNLFGTTADGGSAKCSFRCGTVFKIAHDGTESILHFFTGTPQDGATPYAGLVADEHGNLYGTTVGGGANDMGTVYRIAPDGSETLLHSFAGSPRDGAGPIGGLIRDGAGNLYGTTGSGGSTKNCLVGCGTVFRIATDGTETVLHYFKGGRDGSDPLSSLTLDKQGNIYGTSFSGGTRTCFICGTIFGMSPDGRMQVRFRFEGGKKGGNPWAGLVVDSTGHLYGTTINDGGNHVKGTVFKFTP